MSTRAPYLIGAVLVTVLLIVALVAGDESTSDGGPPLSPSSTATDGTRALVLLLDELGADVRVGQGVPDADTRVALLLADRAHDRTRDELASWVDGGGTLVVTDPGSPLAADAFSAATFDPDRGGCTIAALDDVASLRVAFATLFRVPERGQSCFGDGRDAFIVSTPRGSGTVISIGGADLFTNELLDQADNSVLAARLLAPDKGGSVAVLDPNPAGSGETTLLDLVSDRVFQAIIQLGVAFILYALWRSRRVGRPVMEPQPVAIAGSQFVRAVGGLQQRSHATDRAAAALRADTRHLLGDRYGVPPTTDTQTLAHLVSSRTRLDREQIAAALGDDPVLDENALVQLGHQLDTIRQEVLDGRTR